MIRLFGRGKKKAEESTAPTAEAIPAAEAPIAEAPLTEEAPSPTVLPEAAPEAPAEKSWLGKLKSALSKTASPLTDGIGKLFTHRKLDDDTLEELQELLILSDMGVTTARKLTDALKREKFDKDISADEVRNFLSTRIAEVLEPVARPLEIPKLATPFVLTVVGVNGVGKTTTIGKIAQQWQQQKRKVVIAAADTFRAAAVEQLQVWGERSGCAVITGKADADPASVAYQATEQAVGQGADILIIDTAGRLHNKAGLMEELKKIHRVIAKLIPDAPHATLLVLDATTGQNAISQVKHFSDIVPVSGLALTKLDGTAKGGILVALAEQFSLPVHYLGVGEGIDDLRSFIAQDFANSLMMLRK